MALVLNPFQSGEASGKVGSLVAGRNRTGPYMRQNGKPVNPRTVTQTKRRYDFSSTTNTFTNLSTTNIELWIDFANAYSVTNRLGQTSYNTAINWFKALNSRLLLGGFSVHNQPPLNPNPSYFPSVSIDQQAAGGNIVFGVAASMDTGEMVFVYSAGPLTRTRRFKSNSMRLLTIQKLVSQATNKTLIAAASVIEDTTSYQFETRAVDSFGRATAPLRFTVFPVSS